MANELIQMASQVIRFPPGEAPKVLAKPALDKPIFRTIYPPTDATKPIYDEQYRQPSRAIYWRIQDTAPEAEPLKYSFVYTAMVHCGAMCLCDYPFPGPDRQQEWVERALQRASYWVKPLGTLEMDLVHVRVADGIRSAYKCIIQGSRKAVRKHYLDTLQPDSGEAETMISVSTAVENDNFIFRRYNTDVTSRADPFRHPAITDVLLDVLLTEDLEDRYELKNYFYPKIPVSLVVLVCAGLRCALDELCTNLRGSSKRKFIRELYGPIVHSLIFRWHRLDDKYAEDTQRLLATEVYEVMVAAVVDDEAVGSDSDDLMEVEDTLQVRSDNEFDDSTLVMD